MSFDHNYKNTTTSANKINFSINNGRKNIILAYLLWFFLGFIGVHRMYLGRMKSGIAMLIMMCLGAVVPLFAGIVIIVLVFDAFYTWRMVENYNKNYVGNEEFNIEINQNKAESVTDLEKYSVLEKIHDLRERGIISEEEFLRKRNEIFGDIPNKKDVEINDEKNNSAEYNMNSKSYSNKSENENNEINQQLEEDKQQHGFELQASLSETKIQNSIETKINNSCKDDSVKKIWETDNSPNTNTSTKTVVESFFTPKFSEGIRDAYAEVKQQVISKVDTFDRLAKLQSSGVLSAEELELVKNKIVHSTKETLDKAKSFRELASSEIKEIMRKPSDKDIENKIPPAWVWGQYRDKIDIIKSMADDSKKQIELKDNHKVDQINHKIEALRKLAQLRDAGILTQSEFECEKAKLL